MGTLHVIWVATPGKLQGTCNLHVKFHVLSLREKIEKLNNSKFLKNGSIHFD